MMVALPMQLLNVLLLILQILATTSLAQNETDKSALLAFKEQVMDPLGALTSWNESNHYCEWSGVSCSRRHRSRVTSLDLTGRKLGGSLTPWIGNLTFLRYINLGLNSFRGEIPKEIGRLFRLRYLNLTDNAFQGEIPSNLSFCLNLQVIDMNANRLEGKIPDGLRRLANRKLKVFYVSKNNLTGVIPRWLGNSSSLVYLSMEWNNFEGSIPDELGRISKLLFLQLAANKLSGRIPPAIYNRSSLRYFSVANNNLHGEIPSDIGLTLYNLRWLYFSMNSFYGRLPVSLPNASLLKDIGIAQNLFSGPIPSNLGSLKGLEYLGLLDNQLENEEVEGLSFLTSLTNCSNLRWLLLSRNNLKGELPVSIANFSTNLEALSFYRNQISGNIPEGIGNLIDLNALFLWGNFITGEIPSSLGKLERLTLLHIGQNGISGVIPSSLGNLTQLLELGLEGNNLGGTIPPSFGKFLHIERHFLTYNKLTGNIPKELFSSSTAISFNLAHNYLTGSLPEEVGNMTNLLELDVSHNKLFGGIPTSLGGCLMLETLRLQENLLGGSIPPSLSTLRSLHVFDLSRNKFSGQIPRYIQNFTLLQNLNLSFNNLEGEVPHDGVFKNASAVLVVGNQKLCGGINKLGLPPCKMQAPKKQGTSFNLKLVIPVIVSCVVVLALAVLFIFCCVKKSRRKAPMKLQSREQFPKISFAELSQATNDFSLSSLIGVGSFGSVYKGIIGEDETTVAVKVLNLKQKGAAKSFLAECEALRNIRHRNLIRIITVCSSIDFKGNDFKAIVYEFMQNGSLDEWLHPSEVHDGVLKLSLIQRLNIVIGVASAIEYLHFHCQPSIIHGDLKPSNVLLNHEMVAHVADFGLARFQPEGHENGSSETQGSSIGIRGSIGYVAPEYGMGGKASMSGDVYSFGVLLLEIITGKRPTDVTFKDGLTLHQLAKVSLPERVMDIVDPPLIQEAQAGERTATVESLAALVKVGVSCSIESPDDRMKMKDVVAELRRINEVFLGYGF